MENMSAMNNHIWERYPVPSDYPLKGTVMKKWMTALMFAMGAVAVTASAMAQEGEWLPVRQKGDTTYSIYTSDYQVTENTIKNNTGHVWLKIEDGKDITVIRAKSDCNGQSITIEDQYTNGKQGKGAVQQPVEPDSTADIINRVICKELNFGD